MGRMCCYGICLPSAVLCIRPTLFMLRSYATVVLSATRWQHCENGDLKRLQHSTEKVRRLLLGHKPLQTLQLAETGTFTKWTTHEPLFVNREGAERYNSKCQSDKQERRGRKT